MRMHGLSADPKSCRSSSSETQHCLQTWTSFRPPPHLPKSLLSCTTSFTTRRCTTLFALNIWYNSSSRVRSIATACADKPRTKIKMGPHDIIELLANLDIVVERIRGDSGRPHKSEVLRKLQPRLRKLHTERQIDNKLKSLIGSTDPKTIEDVYRYGSSRIKNLDVDLKAKVLEELKTIKSEEVCVVVSTPRQLRSVSRNPVPETSRSTRGSTIFGERTPTRSASRNLAIETSRSIRGMTNFGERTPTRTVRKTQRGEPQTRAPKLVKKEPLLSKVRNSFEIWKQ
jgi:hypothetical protein